MSGFTILFLASTTAFRYAGQPIMKVEDETSELLDDVPDEITTASEEEGVPDEEGFKEEAQTDSSLLSSTGHRKIATIIAIVAILLGLLISTYQNTQSKPKVIYATRLVRTGA